MSAAASGASLSLGDVERAREVIRAHVHRTPLLSSRALSERIGAPAYLKAESLQRTGSFKVRGAVNAVSQLSVEQRANGIVTMSAGNAAQAIAFACRAVGAPVTVAMPETAPRTKVDATRGYGALIRFGRDTTALMPIVRELEAAARMYFLHPFDDDAMIAGHGTIALEILDRLPDAGLIVVPVGGGALIAGIALAVAARRPQARVVGVEPAGAAGMRLALDAGQPVPLTAISTVADALAAPFAGVRPLEIVRACVEDVVTIDDSDIVEGVRFLAARARLVAEPGGAAAVGALLAGRVVVRPGERVVAIVSGGNIDLARAAEIFTR
ncbi:MAG: threonine/serine dehydratase [Candidatus Limnocylindria bacterium]